MKDADARDILGVEPDATENEIESRYRELVKKNHPDQGGSTGLFNQIQNARDTLTETNNTEGQQGANQNTSRREQSDNEYSSHESEKVEFWTLANMTEIQIQKIAESAASRILTTKRLKKKSPGITHPQTLTNAPLIEYIWKEEQPHFALRFKEISIDNDTQTPENGGFLVLTDVRILVIFGYESGDECHTIQYSGVHDVNYKNSIFPSRKFTIKLTDGTTIQFKIEHASLTESGVDSEEDLDREIQAAEEFVREAAYMSTQ